MAYSSRVFSSLIHYRNYRLLFITLSISQIGTGLQDVAQSWLILEKTHSAQAVATLTALLFAPYAILGLISAPLLERLHPRNTMIVCQALSFISAISLAILCFTEGITVHYLYLFALLRGFLVVVNNPVRQLLIRQCVDQEHMPNAIALSTSILNIAKVVGPAAGGLLLAYAGAGYCFLLNALSFLVVISGLCAMDDDELYSYRSDKNAQPLFKKIGAALTHLKDHPPLLMTFIVFFFISLSCLNFSVFLPLIFHDLLTADAATFGYINALFALGAFSGAIISAHAPRVGYRKILLSAGCMGAIFIAVPFAYNDAVIICLLFVLGGCYTMFTTAVNAYIQVLSPEKYQVSNIALYTYILTGINPLGALFIGLLEKYGGVVAALAVPGLLALSIVVFGKIMSRNLR